MCVMEAVAFVAGERHSDHPTCACHVIAPFARLLNDLIDDDELRTRLLVPRVIALVGSRSTTHVEVMRVRLAVDWAFRVALPTWWNEVPELRPYAAMLRSLAPLVSEEAIAAARTMVQQNRAAVREVFKGKKPAADAAAYAAADAAYAAAYAAADAAAAAYAAADAAYAAYAAADAAYAAADAAYAAYAAADAPPKKFTYAELLSAARARLRPVRERVWSSAAHRIDLMLMVTPETDDAALAQIADLPTELVTTDAHHTGGGQ
jgi:hypothetical protein